MRVVTFLCIGAFAPALAAGTGLAPQTQPAATRPSETQPSESDIAALVRQLADPSYRVRRGAERKLRDAGPAALPALNAVGPSDEFELQIRARELAEQAVRPLIPDDVPQPMVAGNGGFYNFSSRSEERNGVKIVDAREGGRTIHIECEPGSVRMTVTGQIKGQSASREYRARSAYELRRANAAVYAIYQKWMRLSGKPQNRDDLPPPPPSARLGVDVGRDSDDGSPGLDVTYVLPNARGEKLGLRLDDVIERINDQPVRTAQDLRRLLIEHADHLVLGVFREGKPLTLEDAK